MASAHSLEGLMKWLNREEWREAFEEVLNWHLAAACTDADVSLDELPSLIGDDVFSVLWGCAFEDMLATNTEDGRNIVDDYLKRRGWTESVTSRNYMLALRSSVMSLYEISDIVPEESFLARDLVRGGEPVRVSEKSGTQSLKQWDRLAARIVHTGSRTEMAGGVLPFDHDASDDLIEAMREAGRKARAEALKAVREAGTPLDRAKIAAIDEIYSDTEILRASAFVFTNAWLEPRLQEILNPQLPELCNSDGDPLVFITAHYPLAETSGESVRTALAGIPALQAADESFWNWTGPQRRRGRKRPAGARALVSTLEDGSIVLGTLELKERTLELGVNSEARLRQGRTLIDPLLAGLVGEPLIERKTVPELMANAPENLEPLASGLPPDEERALIDDMLTDHYRRTLDEPIAALGHQSPRRAVKTAKGRQKVIAWLKLLENQAARERHNEAIHAYDFGWMWQELGLADRRR
ncbi:MAG TPA: hypothetical protein VJR47_18245 [Stellaceae bacterium]|nr:hypothetical protein [Stellaceae bacterium]